MKVEVIGNATLYLGDALLVLREFPNESVQCCVTSPPYWGLRDYGIREQLGVEKTPGEYVAKVTEVFREVRRVLCGDGVCWLNLGDSYAGGGREGIKPKDLVGIPWRVAFALQADGWYLRSDIIWSKPNPMPESVRDRPTSAHEHIFLLTKSSQYYYDAEAVREAMVYGDDNRPGRASMDHSHAPTEKMNGIRPRKTDKQRGHSRRHAGFNDRWDLMTKEEQQSMGRNLRNVWTIAPKPYPEAHFATFPPDIPEKCIAAGSKAGDVIIDPFAGSGTTGEVALRIGRQFIGIELNEQYMNDFILPRIDQAQRQQRLFK